MMFFMPLLQCAAIVAFLVPWAIYSVYTASLADVSNACPLAHCFSIFCRNHPCPCSCFNSFVVDARIMRFNYVE